MTLDSAFFTAFRRTYQHHTVAYAHVIPIPQDINLELHLENYLVALVPKRELNVVNKFLTKGAAGDFQCVQYRPIVHQTRGLQGLDDLSILAAIQQFHSSLAAPLESPTTMVSILPSSSLPSSSPPYTSDPMESAPGLDDIPTTPPAKRSRTTVEHSQNSDGNHHHHPIVPASLTVPSSIDWKTHALVLLCHRDSLQSSKGNLISLFWERFSCPLFFHPLPHLPSMSYTERMVEQCSARYWPTAVIPHPPEVVSFNSSPLEGLLSALMSFIMQQYGHYAIERGFCGKTGVIFDFKACLSALIAAYGGEGAISHESLLRFVTQSQKNDQDPISLGDVLDWAISLVPSTLSSSTSSSSSTSLPSSPSVSYSTLSPESMFFEIVQSHIVAISIDTRPACSQPSRSPSTSYNLLQELPTSLFHRHILKLPQFASFPAIIASLGSFAQRHKPQASLTPISLGHAAMVAIDQISTFHSFSKTTPFRHDGTTLKPTVTDPVSIEQHHQEHEKQVLSHPREHPQTLSSWAQSLLQRLTHNYLCGGTTLFLSHEPCCMCSMAMVHSRIDAIVFFQQQPHGTIASQTTIQHIDGINHRYDVFFMNFPHVTHD